MGEDISFDRAILNDFKCKIFAFDPTPKSIEWIKDQKISDNFIFFPYGVSNKTEEQVFHLSNTPLDISASAYLHEYTVNSECITVKMKRLDDIAAEHQHTYIDILKMDIEGSEFAIIDAIPDMKNLLFGQILVEFHDRFFRDGKRKLRKALRILQGNGYYCFAVSKNGDEYSFINKKEYERKFRGK